MQKILIKIVKPLKGSIEFFNWAKNKNISMAVCTNKQERLA